MKESIGNMGLVHKECAINRRTQWQTKNKDLKITKGSCAKICFVEGKENEWMWVEITSVSKDGKTRKGFIANDPAVVNLVYGQKVTFTRDEISEYLSA